MGLKHLLKCHLGKTCSSHHSSAPLSVKSCLRQNKISWLMVVRYGVLKPWEVSVYSFSIQLVTSTAGPAMLGVAQPNSKFNTKPWFGNQDVAKFALDSGASYDDIFYGVEMKITLDITSICKPARDSSRLTSPTLLIFTTRSFYSRRPILNNTIPYS